MTFEEANEILVKGKYKLNDKAWNAFDIQFRGSICHSCVHYKNCRARYSNDEQDWIIAECNFFKNLL